MQNLYGWDDYFGKFNGLNPKLGRSINDVMPVLVSGERALGISTLGQTLTRKAKGDPIDVIYPEEGAVVVGWSLRNSEKFTASQRRSPVPQLPDGRGILESGC